MSADQKGTDLGRRHALRRLAMLGAAAASPAFLASETAFAAAPKSCHGTTAKASVRYQKHPKDTHKCSNCTHFCPGSSAKAMGSCEVVKGSISPHGWCLAWASKS